MAVYTSIVMPWVLPDRIMGFRMGRLLEALARGMGESAAIAQEQEQAVATLSSELDDVRQSRKGDSDAYQRLIEQNQEHVSRILWRFTRDRVVHEELVQDVFVEAYIGLRSYRGKAPFAHWLSRIATRTGYRYWRRMARRHETESFSLEEWDQVADPNGTDAEDIDPGRAAELVHSLLAQLGPRDRLVLTLRYLEGCDVAETAHRTGWTKGMVKVQSLRARKKLQKLLAKTGKGWKDDE